MVPRSSEAQSNPRGIPVAPFVDDVEKFVDSRADIEPNLKKFQEMIAFVPPPVYIWVEMADCEAGEIASTSLWK